MITPSHWRIYTIPAISRGDFNRLEGSYAEWPVVRLKLEGNPQALVCYDCTNDEADAVADSLIGYGYDVLAVQSGVGPVP